MNCQAFTRGAVSLVVAAGAVSAAQACGYHDPSSVNLGMLNWAYPDALHVRTAVWMAQRDRLLARTDPPGLPPGAASATDRFEQMLRYRGTQVRLDRLQDGLQRARHGGPMPSFSIVLIGPMLWTRFERAGELLQMQVHATGPARDDVVIVTDEPVVAALSEGRLAPGEARERGLVKFYGEPGAVEQISTLFDRMPLSIDQDVGHKSVP